MDSQRDREIGARLDGEMNVRLPGERRGARVDDDQGGAAALGLADVRHEVDTRDRRIRAPDDDQPASAKSW